MSLKQNTICMKKKVYSLLTLAIFGLVFLLTNRVQANCDSSFKEYRKRFLVSGCRAFEGDICVIRCAQPNWPGGGGPKK
jgi:hypothetical protein